VVDQTPAGFSSRYCPAVDMDSDGDFVVSWTSYAQRQGEIRARAYDLATFDDTLAAYCFYGDPHPTLDVV
jgi:hypothetical protein